MLRQSKKTGRSIFLLKFSLYFMLKNRVGKFDGNTTFIQVFKPCRNKYNCVDKCPCTSKKSMMWITHFLVYLLHYIDFVFLFLIKIGL